MNAIYMTAAWSRPILCMYEPGVRLVPIGQIPPEEPAANDAVPAAIIQAPGRSRPALQLV